MRAPQPAARRRKRPESTAARLLRRLLRSALRGLHGMGRQLETRWLERRPAQTPSVNLIGLDVRRPPLRLRTRSLAPLLAAGVLGALLLAGLRMDVIRMRFALAEAFEQELALEQVERELLVEMRRLRDPAQLAARARSLGFERARKLIDLAEPAVGFEAAGALPTQGTSEAPDATPGASPKRTDLEVELASVAGRRS